MDGTKYGGTGHWDEEDRIDIYDNEDKKKIIEDVDEECDED